MTHNANEDVRDGIVTRENRTGNDDWDVLWVPNTVRSIREQAYEDATNIREIHFEDGDSPLTLYARAFARCVNLERVVLPNRIETIQDQCFEGCTSLKSFAINPGSNVLCCGFNVFNGCPEAAAYSERLREEQVFRRTPGLGWRMNVTRQKHLLSADELREKLEEIFMTAQSVPDNYFNRYTQEYRTACESFGRVDWNNASGTELELLLHADNNGVAKIDNGSFDFQRVPWRQQDFPFYQEVGLSLVGLENTAECARRVYGIRRRFYDNLPRRANGQRIELKVVFNRAIAALNPSVVVQVPDQDKLHLLLDWLYSHGMMADQCHFHYDDWFESSAAIRSCLRENLPVHDQYELGVFAWILTEALLPDPGKDSKVRQEIMQPKMHELGLL